MNVIYLFPTIELESLFFIMSILQKTYGQDGFDTLKIVDTNTIRFHQRKYVYNRENIH
jgi:hypothetical protein